MKPIITLTIMLFLSLTFAFAQGQNGFVSLGGNDSGAGGSLSYSLGQMVYTVITSIDGNLSQGIQQPYEIYEGTLGINEYPDIHLDIKVYPNPTVSNVILSIGKELTDGLAYQLFDLNGRLLFSEKINIQKSTIPFENLPVATYFLNITQNSFTIKTFKIIKK